MPLRLTLSVSLVKVGKGSGLSDGETGDECSKSLACFMQPLSADFSP